MMRRRREAVAMMLVAGGVAALSGCVSAPVTAQDTGRVPSPVYLRATEETRTDGSLWVNSQSNAYFFQDYKASRVGDTIRVNISETTKGKKEANTKTKRKSAIAATTVDLLGIQAHIPSVTERLGLEAEFEDEFEGKATTDRKGEFTATITAVVTEVFPNGSMVIEGHREVSVNNEKEMMTLTGIIRPFDISPSNTIQSEKISDAKITFSGRGVLNDKQRPGWLVRIIDWIWPF
jgi:flagellar L-ring protein precursor FlgH